jgi:putative transposase
MESTISFEWRHFQKTIILQCVRLYLGFSLMQIEIRQIKYLNNIVEQDHRGIKRITKPMMGFKSFQSAGSTIAGVELCRMLKKGQHVDAKNSPAFEQLSALAG